MVTTMTLHAAKLPVLPRRLSSFLAAFRGLSLSSPRFLSTAPNSTASPATTLPYTEFTLEEEDNKTTRAAKEAEKRRKLAKLAELKRWREEPPPPYPYAPAPFLEKTATGLYGGAVTQYGNKISKGRNKGKTRRTWKLNIRHELVRSNVLGNLRLKVTHRVLRTIKKVGGLDQYLLGDKPARIKELGLFGWNLRWRVMQEMRRKKKFEEEERQLGLLEPEES
ncbi:hypothetical protein AJ79_08903 [Helicocarpus griseus UAMH5409]|uniref:Ribosomal protein L28 n=1 Tax=Helicocarpus griseus UAMH5409 TaxID=1447875 RepID=A0A2B7WP12_9EURO|nr:hypothetical protein AJ79_08903 [Helicocarpus griseus UAMH5409]